jgi:hypothetical protein
MGEEKVSGTVLCVWNERGPGNGVRAELPPPHLGHQETGRGGAWCLKPFS